jgi:hypothetical protein
LLHLVLNTSWMCRIYADGQLLHLGILWCKQITSNTVHTNTMHKLYVHFCIFCCIFLRYISMFMFLLFLFIIPLLGIIFNVFSADWLWRGSLVVAICGQNVWQIHVIEDKKWKYRENEHTEFMCCVGVDCVTVDWLTQWDDVAQINKPTVWLHREMKTRSGEVLRPALCWVKKNLLCEFS